MGRNSTGLQLDRPIRQSSGSRRRRHSATDSVAQDVSTTNPKRRGSSQSIQRSAGPEDVKRSSKPSRQSFPKDVHSLPGDCWDTGMPRWRRRIVFNCSRKYMSHSQFEKCICPQAKLQFVAKAIRTGLRVAAIQFRVVELWKDSSTAGQGNDAAEVLAEDLEIGQCPEVFLNSFKEVHRQLVDLKNEPCMRAKLSHIAETMSVKLMSLEELRAKADAHREEYKTLKFQLNELLHSTSTMLEKTTRDLYHVYRALHNWADDTEFNEMSGRQGKYVGEEVERCLSSLRMLCNRLTMILAIDDNECDRDSGDRSVHYKKLAWGEPALPAVKDTVPGLACMPMYGVGEECLQSERSNTKELDADACGSSSPAGDECVQPVQSNAQELDEDACKLISCIEEEGLQEHSVLANEGGSEKQFEQGDDGQHELLRLSNDQVHSNSEMLSVIKTFSDNDGPTNYGDQATTSSSYTHQSDELRAPSTASSTNQSEELRQNTGQSEIVQGGTGSKDAQQVFVVVKPTRPKPRYSRSHENCGQYSKYSPHDLSELEKQILASIVEEDYARLHAEPSRPPELGKQAIKPSLVSERTCPQSLPSRRYRIEGKLQQKPCCPSKGQAQAFRTGAAAVLKPKTANVIGKDCSLAVLVGRRKPCP